MGYILHGLSFNSILLTSWCLVFLQTTPCSFLLFAFQKEGCSVINQRQPDPIIELPDISSDFCGFFVDVVVVL